jgi:hypothetical protein
MLAVAQPGGTVCTDVRCFTGTLSTCWTYRRSTSARGHVRDRLRMHARTAKSSSLHAPPTRIEASSYWLRRFHPNAMQDDEAASCPMLGTFRRLSRASGPLVHNMKANQNDIRNRSPQ